MTEPVQLNSWQKQMAIEYAPMAERIAIREWDKKYRQIETVLPFEEIHSLVNLGLVKACSHLQFDPEGMLLLPPGLRGPVPYIERYMVGEIQEHLRRLDHASRKVRGLMNMLPKEHVLNVQEVMLITDCDQHYAEQVMAAINHDDGSLEAISTNMASRTSGGRVFVDDWESSKAVYVSRDNQNQFEDEDDSETWLDRDGLAIAVALRLESMDDISRAAVVLNFVENVDIKSIPTELEAPVSLVNKRLVTAIENIRDFVVSWCAVA